MTTMAPAASVRAVFGGKRAVVARRASARVGGTCGALCVRASCAREGGGRGAREREAAAATRGPGSRGVDGQTLKPYRRKGFFARDASSRAFGMRRRRRARARVRVVKGWCVRVARVY